jgi:hypothetical protein
MPNRNITLSIRDRDTGVWDQARIAADAQGTTLSYLTSRAVEAYLAQQDTTGDTRIYETIALNIRRDDEDQLATFQGRWLLEPQPETGFGVAQTAKGRIAVYHHRLPGQFRIDAFDDLYEAMRALGHLFPGEAWDDARTALTPKKLVQLDI